MKLIGRNSMALVFLCLSIVCNIHAQSSKQKKQAVVPDYYIYNKDINYAGNENPKQSLDIFWRKDKVEKKLPVLVFIHGGGFRKGSKEGGIRNLDHFLKTGKYIGITINYRLSGDAKWPAQIHDCKAAIRWIRGNAEKYGIDKDKIGVWGTSAGGHLAAMLALTTINTELEGKVGSYLKESSIVTCAVDGFGPADFLTMDERPHKIVHNAADSPESLLIGGPIQENKEKAKNASPLSWVRKNSSPMLIYHGSNDELVIIEQSEILYKTLQKKKAEDIYFIKIDGGPHGVRHPVLTERMTDFFNKYLYEENIDILTSVIDYE